MNQFYSGPQLVTLEGDADDLSFLGGDSGEVAELLGIDYDDAEILTETNRLTPRQVAYLNSKYPEYMGIWPLIAKAGALIIKGGVAIGKGIAKAVKAKRQKTADNKAAQQKEAEEKAIASKAAADKKASEKKLMLMIGIPIAGLAAIMLLKK
jgi:hypothetical protein